MTDAKSGSPIAGASVVVGTNFRRANTNSFGQYSASFPANADVSVAVHAQGFGGGLAIGRLGSHKTAVVNFKLNRVTKSGAAPPELPQLFGSK